MKLDQGDYLEVNFKDSIRQLIPYYEQIWGEFIGHDGNGSMIKLNSLTEDENSKRIKFAENFYTCMESVICMNYIAEEIKAVEIQKPNEYIILLNSFMAFQAHAGRVRDNTYALLSICLTKERTDELITQLEDVYQQRNEVLHGKKLPVRIEDSLVLIAPPKGKEETLLPNETLKNKLNITLEKWHSKLNWSDFEYDDSVFINDYLKSTINQVSKAYNNIVANLIKPIKEIVKLNNIDIDEALRNKPESQGIIGAQGPISGGTKTIL